MKRLAQQKASRMLNRPGRVAGILVGLAAFVVGLLLDKQGVSWKYSETGLGTIMLLWCLLSAFRPEWHRRRFWIVLAAIITAHLAGWVYLAQRIERFGFILMFILIIVEIMLGAGVILRAIPEDYQVMVDYIYRW